MLNKCARLLFIALFITAAVPGMSIAAQAQGPRLGTWELTGRDKIDWKATLVFTLLDRTICHGYFKWQSNSSDQASGLETFEGIFNPADSMITLKGLDMKDKKGQIATGSIYEATVTENGYALINGRWFGTNVAPGTWSAIWQSADIPNP
jgi:hypothetical protein